MPSTWGTPISNRNATEDALRTYRRALGLENANVPELRKKIKNLESGTKESGL